MGLSKRESYLHGKELGSFDRSYINIADHLEQASGVPCSFLFMAVFRAPRSILLAIRVDVSGRGLSKGGECNENQLS